MAKGKMLMGEYHARLGATLMFTGFQIPDRSKTIGNWMLKELKKFSDNELATLNHELHTAMADKATATKDKNTYSNVVGRINQVKLARYYEREKKRIADWQGKPKKGHSL